MTKIINSNYDKTHNIKLWQLKNSNCDKSPKLKLSQNSKTQIVTKLKNSNCDNSKTQIVIKYKLWKKLIFSLKIEEKHRKNCEKLPWELLGCQGVKVFLLKDVIITTSVTTVIFITITIWVFELSQFYFFLVLHNLSFWVWPQFDLLSFVTICFFEFYHSLSSSVLPQLGFFFSFVTVLFFFSFVNIRVFFSFVTIRIF